MHKTNLIAAMTHYNKANNYNFTLIDAFIVQALSTNSYTTDADLAAQTLCSERTIKRSINKLCSYGLITKHLAHDHTKTVKLCETTYNQFLNYKEI